jgi:uncharacterized protein YggU (UPF0235/DUF167 family)
MYIHVKAKTEMRKEEVVQVSDDHYEIAVREPAERNLANKRILAILQTLFPNKIIRIINGHHSKSKLIAVDDIE